MQLVRTWPEGLPDGRPSLDQKREAQLDQVAIEAVDGSDVKLIEAKIRERAWSQPRRNRVRIALSPDAAGSAFKLVTTFAIRVYRRMEIPNRDQPSWEYVRTERETFEYDIVVIVPPLPRIEIALDETATLTFPVVLTHLEPKHADPQAEVNIVGEDKFLLRGNRTERRPDSYKFIYRIGDQSLQTQLAVHVRDTRQVLHVVLEPGETVTLPATELDEFLDVRDGGALDQQWNLDVTVATVEVDGGNLRVVGRGAGEQEIRLWYGGTRRRTPVQTSVTLRVTVTGE